MRNVALRTCSVVVTVALLLQPPSVFAQNSAPAAAPVTAAPAGDANKFNPQQLDALLAPIALYPDTLLVQVQMASTVPLEIVTASRWLADGDNKSLKGDALVAALDKQNWDPSVKSLVPFPQVLAMMNAELDWTQQLGYAFATQQNDVMDSVQRLRRQAQAAGTLKSNEQQVVQTVAPSGETVATVNETGSASAVPQTIVIQPANPEVVYVPTYNPTAVYGTWPYPSYPPVYLPPPVGYGAGTALVNGMAFMAGAAVVGSLWGWASPGWGGYGGGNTVNINNSRYNNITRNNASRGNVTNGNWRAPAAGAGGRPTRPPGGPVGRPNRGNGLPANAVGRPNVKVPGSAVNRPNIGNSSGSNRANVGTGGNRPSIGSGNGANRPNVGASGAANRPRAGAGGAASRGAPARPAQARPAVPPRSALSGAGGNGQRASQYQSRGSQSRSVQQQRRPAGGAAARGRGGQRGGRGGGGGARRR
jgi:Protein of unknown function (DUF3300)